MTWWPIVLALLIALAIAVFVKYLPDLVLDVIMLVTAVFLVGVFASTYASWDSISDLFSRFTWMLYIVGAAGGLLLGNFLKKYVPLPF